MTVRNAIPGSVLTMHGLLTRPATVDRPVRVPFGATREFRFGAGAPGTYLYWGSTTAKPLRKRFGADSQLNGALVVDPPAPRPAAHDRVFVITTWVNVTTKRGRPNNDYELDAINGRAWPHTERLSYAKGETVRWRVLNASDGAHPLHLHGFYFDVTSRGNGVADIAYAHGDRDRVVTEAIKSGSTFTMAWHADRVGNWLFHCHLPYHTVGHLPIAQMLDRTPITDEGFENDFVRHAGMGGLILGVTVRGRPPQAATHAAVGRRIALRVEAARDDAPNAPSYRYIVGSGAAPGDAAIGPPIVLTRGVPVAIDVTNRLSEPTAVHWHGIEVGDSYFDGVAEWSGYADRLAPMIMPGETFVARFTPPR
ncbi:MAG TPA: multicopper oxidase domain-containing protein, partial [Candidatus Elarobacter sp.]